MLHTFHAWYITFVASTLGTILEKKFHIRYLITTVHQNIIKIYLKNFPMKGLKTSFISLMKVLRALDRPKATPSHLYNPYLVLKVIFHSSPSFIII